MIFLLKKVSIRKKILAIMLMGLFILVFVSQNAKAIIPTTERITKCKKMLDNKTGKEDVEALEKCERILNTKVETTTQKKNILINQVQLYNLKVKRAVRNLNSVEKKVERNELELKNIQEELRKQDAKMAKIKKQLKENIVLYEQDKQDFKLNLLDSEKSLMSVMDKSSNLSKLSEEISKKLESMRQEKKAIIVKQANIKKAKSEVEKNKKELELEKSKLETQRRVKNDFLVETKGSEAEYKGLLSRIEVQKQQIVNLSMLSTTAKGSIAEIKRKAKKPKDGLASTSWYYDQADPKWAHTTIGFSRTLMKDYGCAVTALSMVFTEAGEKIKPGKMAKKPMFYRDLIVWPNTWGDLKLKSGRAHGNISWSKIDKQLKKKKTAIVFIRSRSGAGHYVVVHHKDKKGKYVVHDPLFGANIYLETSKKLISSIYKSSVTVDQMLLYE
jgi:peptidoglycan hydrolase CwlO-like protein